MLLAPDRINDPQIAIDRDNDKVEHGTLQGAPERVLADQHHTEPVSERSAEVEVGNLQRVRDDDQDGAGEIEHVLIENQRVLPVLLRRHHGV